MGVKPEDVVATLVEFVDFRGDAGLDAPRGPEVITQLKKGLDRSEAERLFGRPVQSTEKREGSIVVTTLIFVVGEQRIAADFVEDVLVRYTITSK